MGNRTAYHCLAPPNLIHSGASPEWIFERRLAITSWENRTSGRAQGQPDKIATAGTARAPIASRERRLSTSVKREGVSSPNYLLRALGERRVSARQGGRVRRAIEATRLGAEVKLEGVSSEHLSLPSVFPP
jgi:hypothetical protein